MEKTKLPEPFRTDWINALRSGEYKQGFGTLYADGCFCCLGVGANVKGASAEQLKGWCYMPGDTQFQVDLNAEELIGLANMNDTGLTFPEIADYIEQNH